MGVRDSRPFLVYAFIREELLYSTTHSPELRTESLFVDKSHLQQEKNLLRQSSRLGKRNDRVAS